MKLKRPLQEVVHFPSRNCMNIAVDHSTGAAFVGWYQTKKGFIDSFCSNLHHWETSTNQKILPIRCDDAVENKSLQLVINGAKWKKAKQFKYIAKTPQRNSRVETKIFHICNKITSAMESANISDQYRYLIFPLFSQ